MKKRKIVTALFAFISACCLTLSACSSVESRGILSIEKTATNGLVDTYTVYYTDGTSSTFEIKNGTDGQNGADGESVCGRER